MIDHDPDLPQLLFVPSGLIVFVFVSLMHCIFQMYSSPTTTSLVLFTFNYAQYRRKQEFEMTMIPIRTTHNYDAVSRFHTSVRLAHAPTIPTLV